MEFQMNRTPKIAWPFMALALLFLSACGGVNLAAPTVDTAFIFTQVASTAWAYQTETVLAVPTATATPTATPTPTATNTPPPTDTPIPTSTPTATVYFAPVTAEISAGPIPTMSVTLIVNDSENNSNSATISVNQVLSFRAQVQNTSNIPLQVVANLSVPDGWGVSENPFSDCPKTEDLALNETCTISWKFNPKVSGQVILRVYVKGFYTDSAGNSQRIADSPAFIFNVE
jgi:hypothetical protein